MTAAPERRWFRYSLRTLFAVVTVVACWLGYELNWIRQRRMVIGDPQVKSIKYHIQISGPFSGPIRRIEYEIAPWPLRWLGEAGYSNILLEMGATDDELFRVRRLFPETGVEVDEP